MSLFKCTVNPCVERWNSTVCVLKERLWKMMESVMAETAPENIMQCSRDNTAFIKTTAQYLLFVCFMFGKLRCFIPHCRRIDVFVERSVSQSLSSQKYRRGFIVFKHWLRKPQKSKRLCKSDVPVILTAVPFTKPLLKHHLSTFLKLLRPSFQYFGEI